MNILITGASGFIGSHLINYLNKKRYLVQGLSRRVVHTKNVVTIPLSNKRRLNLHLKRNKHDIVVHLAATTYNKDPRKIFNNNCQNTLNLLECCISNNVRRLVFASTHLVYGNTKYLPIDEGHPLNPVTNYAISKLIGENICKMFHDSHGLDILILRISSVYGKDQPNKLIIPAMIRDINQNKKLTLHKYQNGFQVMDLINVSDVCSAIELACITKVKFGTYNIATGIPTTVEDIAEHLSKITKIGTINIKKIDNETNHFFYDISLAQKELGFKPKITLDKKTLETML